MFWNSSVQVTVEQNHFWLIKDKKESLCCNIKELLPDEVVVYFNFM